jgi:hypothetical protein
MWPTKNMKTIIIDILLIVGVIILFIAWLEIVPRIFPIASP